MQANRNDFTFHYLKQWIKIYLLHLFIFFLARAFFVFYYGEQTLLVNNLIDVFYSFFLGWKYDTLVISYFLIPAFFLGVIVTLFKSFLLDKILSSILRLYFFATLFLSLFILIADLGFYSYFQDHLNILFYGLLEDDTQAIFETLQKDYPLIPILIGAGIFIVGVAYSLRKVISPLNKKKSKFHSNLFVNVGVTLFAFVLLFGGARGGYSKFVISPQYSDFSEHEFINQISLNGFITFDRAIRLRQSRSNQETELYKHFGYKNIQNALSDYLGRPVEKEESRDLVSLLVRKTDKNHLLDEVQPHVIVLVMESFGAHWNQFSEQQFDFLGGLNKHFQNDYYFQRFLSDANGTIGSLMAITSNIPHRNGTRFLNESRYMQLPLKSAGHIPFKSKGYESSFVYGGKLGWRDIGKYYRYQEFDHIVGENAIKSTLNLSGRVGTEWGLYDEYFFKVILDKIENAQKPQVIIGLSTTNHPPFEVPEDYKAPKLNLPPTLSQRVLREHETFKDRFLAFEYSNRKLSEFISKIKSGPLGEKTIIAVTGDHNFWGFINYSKNEAFMKHTVPLYFYIPEKLKPKFFNKNKLGSHKDIFTTLYHLALSDSEYISFGKNLFTEEPGVAFNGNVLADKNLIRYKNKNFTWESEASALIKAHKGNTHKDLVRKYQSTLSVADYYLRKLFEQTTSN